MLFRNKLTKHTAQFIFFVLLGLTNCSPEKQSSTLFTVVAAEESNVYFNNQIIDEEKYNTLFFANFYGGAGVAIGDLNNDGLQDLYFTGNQVGDKLYINKGALKFDDITVEAGIEDDGGWSSGVLLGDVNKDGYLDIYVTREMYGSQSGLLQNKLYINNQNQTFTESAAAWGIDDTGRSRGGTFFDFDNDGDLDLYVLNTPPNPGPLVDVEIEALLLDEYSSVLYENTGSEFRDITKAAGLLKPGFPNSVVAADLNNDGFQDLYVTNDFTVPDCIYINNGNGTFSDQMTTMTGHISFGSMGVDAADINNDGMLDLFVTDMSAEDNYRIKANMGGMNPEAFWSVVDQGGHYQYMYNTLQINTGKDHFSDVAQLAGMAATDWSWSSFFADFDNDGYKDAFVSNGILRDIRNTDALKKLSDYISNRALPQAINNPDNSINGLELDQQELAKMLDMFPSEELSNYIFKNNGDYTFTKKMEDWGIEETSFSNGSAYGDLDNDGDLDLVINNINSRAQILENHSTDNGSHYLRISLKETPETTALGSKIWLYSDEGMQYFEITGTRGMYSSSEQLAHFGLGDQTNVQNVKVKWSDGKEQTISNPDIDQTLLVDYKDSKYPIEDLSANTEPIYLNVSDKMKLEISHVENDFDDYKLQVLLPHKMSTYGPGLATGDVNGDGNEDFYFGGAAGYAGQIVLLTREGEFLSKPTPAFKRDQMSEDVAAEFFDSDGDGDLDLYVVSGGNEYPVGSELYQDRLYINDGHGNFSKNQKVLPNLTISGSKVRPFDFDQDQDLDLLVTGHHIPGDYPTPASSYLLMNQNGQFTDVTAELAPDLIDIGMVNDAVWVDVDNDNQKDMVLAGEWMPITVLRNKGSKFENVTGQMNLTGATGWWFSLSAADLDNDGDQDLVAGNLGLNYKYKASKEEPFKVYYHDFDLNGSKDIVLAYYNFGNLFPLRGRSCSSEQVPQLSEKFRTYDLFARSELESVYGAENLDDAMEFEASTFATTWFENDGNGQFTPRVLPAQAQFSSVNEILIKDVNDDQRPDLIIAGNLYNAEVETPRNDAGYSLLLMATDNGQFEPVHPSNSGLFLPYNVKSMATLSGASGNYIIAGCNNEPLQVFRENSSSTK